MFNPILYVDGYKLDHRRQYPNGTKAVYANWTPRESRVPGVDHVVFFGLQYFLQKYLVEEFQGKFFDQPVDKVCETYERRINGYLGPNSIGSEHIRALHALGYLPLEFRAVPEGTRVPLRVPMLTVENTLPEFFWLTNYIETLMSCIMWMPCTSATTAYQMKKVLTDAAVRTGSAVEFVPWQGHDFSFRGMPGLEAAALSGAGHLLSFTGTDTLPAIDLIEEYYGPCVAGSVAATEHSVMCASGETGELETFNHLLDLYPSGIVSVVSDTWDLWKVITEILPQLKDRIMTRDGKLVIRPDSGDPVKIICGDPDSKSDNESAGVIELLWRIFGGTTTATGYKLLDSHIGCIYGDSITLERAEAIVKGLEQKGYSSGNMVFGVGSFTYQYVTRDTFGFAMKATWCKVNDEDRDLFKAPKTGNGVKNSAKGRLAVLDIDGELTLCNQATLYQQDHSLLEPVWRDGEFIKTESFADIRARVQGTLV